MNILEHSILELKENIDQIPEEILNKYCIVTTYFHQYARGITGANRDIHAYLSDEFGYKTKREAYKVAAENKLLPFIKKGKKSPYGNVGAKQRTRKILTIKEVILNTPDYAGLRIHKFELL